jgi:hypothetical protein
MTAYEKLKTLNNLEAIDENSFYQLKDEFQATYIDNQKYDERLALHRNPIDIKNELYRELCSYLLRIQSREEMLDIDERCQSYVPTKVKEICMADKRITSNYYAIIEYCRRKSKVVTVVMIHMAEYLAIEELLGKIHKSIYEQPTSDEIIESKDEKKVKKIRTRIPNQPKIKAELQNEINSTCPFCQSTDVGHFEIHHIDGVPSHNEPDNLILVCPTCHSKIEKRDITREQVTQTKSNLSQAKDRRKNNNAISSLKIKGNVKNSTIANSISTHTIIYKSSAKPKIEYAKNSIGGNSEFKNYIKHLIDRYNEYKEAEIGKGNLKYPAIYAAIKKEFKASVFQIPMHQFESVTCYLQRRIDKTMIGRINISKEIKNYSEFKSIYPTQE